MVLQTQDVSKLIMMGERNNSLKCEFTVKHLRENDQVQSLSVGQQGKWSSRHKTLQLTMRGEKNDYQIPQKQVIGKNDLEKIK